MKTHAGHIHPLGHFCGSNCPMNANYPHRILPCAGDLEAAGIEPASDPGRNGGDNRHFVATFNFWTFRLRVIDDFGFGKTRQSGGPWEDLTGPCFQIEDLSDLGVRVLTMSLDEAIPRLERLLEVAKRVNDGHTQEVAP